MGTSVITPVLKLEGKTEASSVEKAGLAEKKGIYDGHLGGTREEDEGDILI